MKRDTVVPREKLVRGEWYIGEGWCTRIALWDGEFFVGYTWTTKCRAVVMAYCADVEGFTPHRVVL